MVPEDRNCLLDSVWSWEGTETFKGLWQTPVILMVNLQRGQGKWGLCFWVVF